MIFRLFNIKQWLLQLIHQPGTTKSFSIYSLYETKTPSGWQILYPNQNDNPLTRSWLQSSSDLRFASLLFSIANDYNLRTIQTNPGLPHDHKTNHSIDGHGLISPESRYPLQFQSPDKACWCPVSNLLDYDYQKLIQRFENNQLVQTKLTTYLGQAFLRDLSRLNQLEDPNTTRAIFALVNQ